MRVEMLPSVDTSPGQARAMRSWSASWRARAGRARRRARVSRRAPASVDVPRAVPPPHPQNVQPWRQIPSLSHERAMRGNGVAGLIILGGAAALLLLAL